MKSVEREITPVGTDDFFIIMNHQNAKFDFPVHFHSDYELNMVVNSSGKRIVGDLIEDYTDCDLVFLGPQLPHAWSGGKFSNSQVITVQFSEDLFSENLLNKKQMKSIKELFDNSLRGIKFSDDVFSDISQRLINLSNSHGFDTILSFLSILYDLSIARGQRMLSSKSFLGSLDNAHSRRIEKVVQYINDNYKESIKLKEVADLVNMSETAFSHFFKKRTHKSFSDYMLDVRVGKATRMLIDTNHNVAEVCYECGFNNISNFNRLFKKKKGCTPKDFRNLEQTLIKF